MATEIKKTAEQLSYIDSPILLSAAAQSAFIDSPMILGVVVQSPGSFEFVNYLVSFSITNIPPTYVYYPVDFSVIQGVAENYPIDFRVIATVVNSYPISFSVIMIHEYPVDFTVVETRFVLYPVHFQVYGFRLVQHLVEFDVLFRLLLNIIEFNVANAPVYEVPVTLFINETPQEITPLLELTSTPSGAAVRSTYYDVQAAVMVSGSYVGGNAESVYVPSGGGIVARISGIDNVPAGTMIVNFFVDNVLAHTYSGSAASTIEETIL